MTRHEATVISAYTGTLLCNFSYLHEYIEKILERPVFTHELGNKDTWEDIKAASSEDFFAIVNNLTY
jgi:hypothetical protein